MVVGFRVDLHGVSMLQSVGSCRDSYHELSEVCRIGCRYSVVKLVGGICVFVVVVMVVVGFVLAVLCCGCVVLGSGGGRGGGFQARLSSCLAAEVQSLWCRQTVDGTVQFAL